MTSEEKAYQIQTVHIGMGGSISCWTDANPVTVVAIKGKRVGIQEDDWKIVKGSEFDGSAEYEYSPNTTSRIRWFSIRKNGRLKEVGGSMNLFLGHRRRYYDPHF